VDAVVAQCGQRGLQPAQPGLVAAAGDQVVQVAAGAEHVRRVERGLVLAQRRTAVLVKREQLIAQLWRRGGNPCRPALHPLREQGAERVELESPGPHPARRLDDRRAHDQREIARAAGVEAGGPPVRRGDLGGMVDRRRPVHRDAETAKDVGQAVEVLLCLFEQPGRERARAHRSELARAGRCSPDAAATPGHLPAACKKESAGRYRRAGSGALPDAAARLQAAVPSWQCCKPMHDEVRT
jgi:hypothetical protein